MNVKHLILSSIVFVACLLATDVSAATISVPPKFISGTGLSNGLVGYWTFDGKDVPNGRVNDVSGSGNHGTLSGIATSTLYKSGKIGQAFNFDGVNDYVNLSNPGTLPIDTFTIAGWFYKKGSSLSFGVSYATSTTFGAASLYYNGGWRCGYNTLNTTNLGEGNEKWIFQVCTYDGSTLRAYQNGVYKNSVAAAQLSGTMTVGHLGKPANSSSFYMDGYIDDVRIYNRALSAAEINQLYSIGVATRQADSPPVTATNCRYGPSCGLIAYWTLDGKDMPGGRATDMSGNGNHANLVSIATSTFYVPGKIGQAGNVDGVDDKINGGSATILDDIATTNGGFTLGMWVKLKDYAGGGGVTSFIASKETNSSGGFGWSLSVANANDLISFGVNYSTTNLSVVSSSGTFPASFLNKWKHVVVTWDGSSTAANVHIYIDGTEISYSTQTNGVGTYDSDAARSFIIGAGDGTSNRFSLGAYDDIRVYNRVLSAAEIGDMYTTSSSGKIAVSPKVTATSTCSTGLSCGLVGYWTFDGKDVPNGRVNDVSGGGNHGTLSGIATSTFYAPGKIGQGFRFDGVNDHVPLPNDIFDSHQAGTVSAWINPSQLINSQCIICVGASNNTNNQTDAFLSLQSSTLRLAVYASASSPDTGRYGNTTIPPNKWTHVVVLSDGTTWSLYVNGVLQTLSSILGSTVGQWFADGSTGTTQYTIGALRENGTTGSFFNGGIDDVRVYNRALTTTEITQLYNQGR